MSKGEGDVLRVYLRAEGEIAKRFRRIKEHMGLKNDTEVLRILIMQYWKAHQDELTLQLTYVNMDENSVKVFDKSIPKVVEVLITPNGVKCDYCETDDCRHVKFAMKQPNVQEAVRKKRRKARTDLQNL